MKLYDVPDNTTVKILDDSPQIPPNALGLKQYDEIKFHHIDGMYSYCTKDNIVCHLAAWTEVEIINETK